MASLTSSASANGCSTGIPEIPLTFLVFDLLRLDGRDLTRQPYHERRRLLDGLALAGPRWRVPEAFKDGKALWEAVCEHELEGVVAKRPSEPYLCGERAWVKVKNCAYWRYELEREGRSGAEHECNRILEETDRAREDRTCRPIEAVAPRRMRWLQRRSQTSCSR
jgi:ATP dependent DNA ligase domain